MDSEVSIQQSADKLIDMKLSLSEVLVPDWKEKSIFASVELALRDEGAKALTDGREVSTTEAELSDLHHFIVEANAIFDQNKSDYHVRLIEDEEGKQKAFIVGRVGKDTFYQTVRFTHIMEDVENKTVVSWTPDTFGIVSENGQVLRIDKILQSGKNDQERDTLLFLEIAGRKYRSNLYHQKGNNVSTATFLPEDYRQMGIFLHELGHLLRKRALKRDKNLNRTSFIGGREFANIVETGSVANPEAPLPNYHIRKIKSLEERGAWALGVSLVKDAGREIGLSCASLEAINEMLETSEQELAHYDKVPYSFLKNGKSKTVPAFSQKQKRNNRRDL